VAIKKSHLVGKLLLAFALFTTGFRSVGHGGLFGLVKIRGGSIAGAKVVAHIRPLARSVNWKPIKGLYYFTLLPPGNYELTVESQASRPIAIQ